VSFSKNKILFRCDAADIPEIGTGHLYRCLTIAHNLKKKFSLRNNQISFLIKSNGKFKKGIKILSLYNYTIIKIKKNLKINSSEEIKYLNKNPSNLLVIDRLGKTNMNFFKNIKSSFKKTIIIDDSSQIRRYFDLSINPLINNVKKFSNSHVGFKYLILPSFSFKMTINIKKNNIFLFFGGYDKGNFTAKVMKVLNKFPIKLNLFIHKTLKEKVTNNSSTNNVFYYNNLDYLKTLKSSNIAITAGGMGLFDSILFNKKIICIPQYKHQEINAKKISNKKAINLIYANNKNFKKKLIKMFLKVYESKTNIENLKKIQKRIINNAKIKKTFQLIFNLYEKSKY